MQKHWHIISRDLLSFPSKPRKPYREAKEEWDAFRRTKDGKRWAKLTSCGKIKPWTIAKRYPYCFIAVNTIFWTPSKFNILPFSSVSKRKRRVHIRSVIINDPLDRWSRTQSFKDRSALAQDSLPRKYTWKELQAYASVTRELAEEGLLRAGDSFVNHLIRRIERTHFFCGCPRPRLWLLKEG